MIRNYLVVVFLPFFLYSSNPAPGKLVEQRLKRIEKQSHRFLRLFSKSEIFTQKDINSYLKYKLENNTTSASLQVKEAKIRIDKDRFYLSVVSLLNEPLPFVDMEALSYKILPITMQFSIEQKSGRYRLKVYDIRIGKAVPSARLALLIMSKLKASTGFNFDVKNWEKFPFGIKKFSQKKGEVKVYF